jgi:DNA-binding NtrC family response regulator
VTPPVGLLRLHPRNLANVLVLGGCGAARREVARAFHRESRLRRGPFVCLDAGSHEPRLRASLEAWLSDSSGALGSDPLCDALLGTLFLDRIDCLTPHTQNLLLLLTGRHTHLPRWEDEPTWEGRLVVGCGRNLMSAVVEGSFSADLYDCLDKVRIELDASMRGVA